MRVSRRYTACVGAAVAVGLLLLSSANAQSVLDILPLSYSTAENSAKSGGQPATANEIVWSDFSALGYVESRRSSRAGMPSLPPPMPAVDGLNAKIDGYGGGASHTSGLYGANGSLAFPLAQQWGAQIDGQVGSFAGSGTFRGAGHLFWRDPAVGLLGAYGSYSRWNGVSGVFIPRTALTIGRFAAEGEYYWGRWTFGGLAGYETVRFNIPAVVLGLPAFSVPNRFFDSIRASYYVTDNFKLTLGHLYTIGRNGLSFGGEYGFALGGGRMAALFAEGLIGERGNNVVLGGLRIYFGQHDKTLIDRNRQDDPGDYLGLDGLGAAMAQKMAWDEESEASVAAPLFSRLARTSVPSPPSTSSPSSGLLTTSGPSFIP